MDETRVSRLPGEHPASTARYAGFWRRLASQLLDLLVLVVGVFGALVIISFFGTAVLSGDGGMESEHFATVEAIAVVVVGSILLLYFPMGNGLGGTPGKRIMGLRVVDQWGNVPGVASGSGRSFVSVVSLLLLGLGYLSMIWDERKQTWHDKVAGTYVLTSRR